MGRVLWVVVMFGWIAGMPCASASELVAHYPLEGNADDASGHGNDGQVIGGVTFTSDTPCGGIGDFDGETGYIEVPESPWLRPGQVTLAAEVCLRAVEDPRGADLIIRKRYLTNDDSYALSVLTVHPQVEFSVNRGSGNPEDGIVRSTTKLVLGRWYHIAATYDGTQLCIYVNGTLEGCVPYATPIAYDGGVLELGASSYVGGHLDFVDGRLDDIRIYDYALVSGDIAGFVPPCTGQLVAYYPFAGDFVDATGHGNDGTVQGGVTLTSSCSGGANSAADFDGQTGYIEVPDSPWLEPQQVSVAAMVYFRAVEDPRGADLIIRKPYLTNDDSYSLSVLTESRQVEFSVNRGSGNPEDGIVRSVRALDLERWYHVAATYDGSELRIYVNGHCEAVAPYSTPIAYDGGLLELGASSYAGGHLDFVDGKLDEIRIYNCGLIVTEIWDLLEDCTSDMAAYYPFQGDFKDESGHGNDGTPHGGVAFTEDCEGNPQSAGDLNGGDGYVDVPDSPWLRPDTLTVTAQVCFRSVEDERGADLIVRKRYLENDDSYALSVLADTRQVEFSVNRGSGNPQDGIVRSTTQLEADSTTWYHVAATYDGAQLCIYVNGVLENCVPYATAIAYDGGALELGASSYHSGYADFVDGKLDEIRIYDYPLTLGEIWHTMQCPDPEDVMDAPDAERTLASRLLRAPVPNPTRGGTNLVLDMPRADVVGLEIFDVGGRRVCTLAEGVVGAGIHEYRWEGLDATGTKVHPGVYFARVRTSQGVSSRSVVVLR
jgi:hypothetical protein